MHRQDELTICGGSAMLGIQEYIFIQMEQDYCTSRSDYSIQQ